MGLKMSEISVKPKRVRTISLCQLEIGSTFTRNNSPVRGKLLACNEGGDAKVQIFHGIKTETLWWGRETQVIPISDSEFIETQEVVQEAQKEKFKKLKEEYGNKPTKVSLGKDRFGFMLSKCWAQINIALNSNFQTIKEISDKCKVEEHKVKAIYTIG
jgi:hypothetical protein